MHAARPAGPSVGFKLSLEVSRNGNEGLISCKEDFWHYDIVSISTQGMESASYLYSKCEIDFYWYTNDALVT